MGVKNVRKLEILAMLFATLLIFSETYVLVIGTGMFDDKSVVPLPGAVKDAQAFKSTISLLDIAKEDNIVYMENPTLAQMKKGILKWAKRATSANDKLILYYSGHGYAKNGDTFLIPRDVAPEFIEDTALNFTKLLERMKDHIKTSNVLIILDTCYAGSLIKDRPLKAIRYGKTELVDLSRHIAFLLSSRGDETSRERPDGGGWFTYYLLKGLEGDANLNGDKYIDIGELYRYVSEKVAKKTEENQHPVLVAGIETMIITEDKKKEYGEILEKIAKLYGHGELDESKYTLYTKILVQSPVQDNEAEDKIRKYIENFYKGNIALDELITLTNMALGKQASVGEKAAVSGHGTKVSKQNSATGFGYLKIIVENPELLEKTDLRISGKLYQVTSEMIKEGVIYLEDVPAGEQVIEIDGPIISRKIVKVNIEPNSLTRVKIRLERAKGSVSIKTEPINAKVYVNGNEYEDRTPTVIKLPTGYYEIKVEKNGYEIEKFYVSVRKNQTKEIMIKLTKIKGKSMYYWIQDEDKVWIKGDWEGEKELWVYYGAVDGYDKTSITKGLVAYYPFNGDAKDYSGNGYDGRTHGVKQATDRFGVFSRAFKFEEDNYSYVDIDYKKLHEILNFLADNGKEFTISFWFKPDVDLTSKKNSNIQARLITDIYGGGGGWDVRIWQGYLNLIYWDGWMWHQPHGVQYEFKKDIWYHLVVTQKEGIVHFYINSIPIWKSGRISPTDYERATIHVGGIGKIGKKEHVFPGIIDEVRVYNRALSYEEIKQLHQETSLNFSVGDKVFDFFDDFISFSLDSSKWKEILTHGRGKAKIGKGILELNKLEIVSHNTFTPPIIVEGKVFRENNNDYATFGFGGYWYSGNCIESISGWYKEAHIRGNNIDIVAKDIDLKVGSWHIEKIIWYNHKHAKLCIDNECVDLYGKTPYKLPIGIGSTADDVVIKADYIFVHKYSPIEPSVTYEEEESGSWTIDGVTYTKRRKVVVESPVKLESYQIALDYKKFGERSLLIMSY